MQIVSFKDLKNMEPEKHSDVKIISFKELMGLVDDSTTTWTPGLREALSDNREAIRTSISPQIVGELT
jgi:hypothetical protein